MKFRLFAILTFWSMARAGGQEFLDRLDDHLTLSAFGENVRARLSGTLDLEYYTFAQPPPGLIDASGHNLFNPRLTLFFDAQLGPMFYFFSQARFDRHFDPTDQGAQARLDEYALRFTPWIDGRFSLQIGKFATVFARWVERHLSWENPFITAPLVYEQALPVQDMYAPYLPFYGNLYGAKYSYLPAIWGPSYASGASIAGRFEMFEYAAEIKNAALASRPESWDLTRNDFDYPTVTGRVGFKPNHAWNFGFSASNGPSFQPQAEWSLPPGKGIGDYNERVFAQDVSYAHGHLQLWAEFHEVRFELPRLGDAGAFGYFLEAKYKLFPQLYAALRWNQMFFDQVPNGIGGSTDWAHDISRLELAATYRFTEQMHVKLEYYIDGEKRGDLHHSFAAQLTIRF